MQIIKNELLNEYVYHEKLHNNMDVFFMPKRGFTKKYAVLATNYGSNDLEFISPHTNEKIKVNEGIAHFLEHKMFEQPDGSNAFDDFAKIGANANAFTNFNMTAYLFSSTENFEEGLRHLISYVQEPYFTEENVEKEKGIIAQEIKMYDDNPDWKLFFNTLKAMYKVHPNSIDIAGTVESIYKITPDELYSCYKTFYSPSNMALFVIGELEKDEVMNMVKSTVKDEFMFDSEIKRMEPLETDEVRQKEIIEQLDVSVPMFSIGYKDKAAVLGAKDLMKKSIVTELILDILFKKGSQLYDKLYREGLVFGGISCDYTEHIDYGYTIISGETRDIEAVKHEIFSAIESAKIAGIDEADFERAKKKKIGSFIKSFDSIEFIANNYLSYYFKGMDILEYYEVLKSIEIEALNERLKEHFDNDMSVISIIMPKEDK